MPGRKRGGDVAALEPPDEAAIEADDSDDDAVCGVDVDRLRGQFPPPFAPLSCDLAGSICMPQHMDSRGGVALGGGKSPSVGRTKQTKGENTKEQEKGSLSNI